MKPVNVLLIVLDATRVDACSCYNPGRPLTPALDELADSGLRFERAHIEPRDDLAELIPGGLEAERCVLRHAGSSLTVASNAPRATRMCR